METRGNESSIGTGSGCNMDWISLDQRSDQNGTFVVVILEPFR